MELDIRAVMTQCNIPLKIYDNVSNVLTRYGDTVFASLDRYIAFPMSWRRPAIVSCALCPERELQFRTWSVLTM